MTPPHHRHRPKPDPDAVPPALAKSPNVMDPAVVADLLNRAADANLHSTLRQGATVHLPDRGHLLMTGDLHDHLPNLKRILMLAKLDQDPDRHLILHEIIHGPNLVNNCDTSVRTLARIAALKIQHPDRLHLLQSNHELAQLLGSSITKQGVSLTEAFNNGLAYLYGDDAPAVKQAVNRFLAALPIAARTTTGLFFAHSLPSPHHLFSFDPSVIHRTPTDADLQTHGPVHKLVWGRHHTQEVADTLAKQWNTSIFVLGHQPAPMGYYTEGDNILVLASNHNHGAALPIDLTRQYTLQDLTNALIPLASIIPT